MLTSYHKIISGVISVAFVVIVQAFASPLPIFRYLIPAFILFVIATTFYNYFYLRQLKHATTWMLVRLTLFYIVWFGVFLLLINYSLRGLFLILSVILIYFFERTLGNFGEQLVANEVLVIAFCLFQTVLGFQFYYNGLESYLYFAEFIALVLLVRSSFSFLPHSENTKLIGALSISLLITQLHWALSFWPLYYSALALALFVLFYALWSIYYYALVNTLSTKRIHFYLGFAAACIILIVLITPWRIIN